MSERKPEWALKLSTELKKWLPEHGYKTSVQLADELDIPRGALHHIADGSGIMTGDGHGMKKFDGRFYYARLHLWTDLEEADPRHIPDRMIKIPKSNNIVSKSRSLSRNEYQQWLASPETNQLLAKKNDRFKRETIMEQPTTSQPTESPPTAGSFLGSVIDNLISNMTDQIANRLLEHQAGLEQRMTTLEDAINRLILSQADRVLPSPPRSSRGSDIGQLSVHFRNLLDRYRLGTSDDRDKLMQIYGRDLMALDMVVHTLTRRPHEREEIIKLTEETKL